MTWGGRICKFFNQRFPSIPNPGGRESELAYQEMQFRHAEVSLKSYRQTIEFHGKDVLDVGCGVGGKTVYYALHCGARSVLGVDVIERFTHLASNFAREKGAGEAVEFLTIQPDTLPFPPESFDVVISNDAIEHIAQPELFLADWNRVLKPGGYFCIDFGPLYYSMRGAHIYDYLNIPWCHLMFSQETLINEIRSLPPLPHAFGHDRTIVRFTELNKMTVRRFRKMIEELDFDVISWEVGRDRRVKGFPVYWLSFLPVVGNLFIHTVRCIVRKKEE